MYFLQLFKYIISVDKETMVFKAIFQLFPLPFNEENNFAIAEISNIIQIKHFGLVVMRLELGIHPPENKY